MKKFLYLSSLPLFVVLAHVSSKNNPSQKQPAALDLQEYIGDVEYGVSEDVVLEGSILDGGAFAFSAEPSAPAFFQRTLSFVRGKVHKLFFIPISAQAAPRLSLPAPIGFMLWFAHLGWYP